MGGCNQCAPVDALYGEGLPLGADELAEGDRDWLLIVLDEGAIGQHCGDRHVQIQPDPQLARLPVQQHMAREKVLQRQKAGVSIVWVVGSCAAVWQIMLPPDSADALLDWCMLSAVRCARVQH